MPTFAEIQNMRVGIWDYVSGTEGSVDTATLLGATDIAGNDEVRVLSITAIAGATDASMQIDNRDAITIPAGQILTLHPNGTIVNPILAFVDTESFVVEFVTNNFRGYTKGDI